MNKLRSVLQGALLLILSSTLCAQNIHPNQAAIASSHPAATVAGFEVLATGGNAFDAAVAISAALAVAEPYGSGLGGGGFFLLRLAGDVPEYRFIDARETAPQAATQNMYFKEPERSINGALAAAIPGLPAALVTLASRYGKLPLSVSLNPAIRLAESGFPVSAPYQRHVAMRLGALKRDPESARLFLREGAMPELNAIIRQPALAETLKKLAQQGFDGFYKGSVAQQLVASVRADGGIWTLEDLANYRIVERAPLRYPLANQRLLVTAPPPSAGGIALAQSLGVLQELPWQQSDRIQRTHFIVETLRRVYRDRGVLGDPDFIENPVAQLLDPAYLKSLASSINPLHATPSSSLPQAAPWKEGNHTTHFSLIDTEGNAVAATLSINLAFGAAFTEPKTGILLNNEMDDLAANPEGKNSYGIEGSYANAIAPGKRPLSSMSPSFIESADELAIFGTPGGSRIPSMVLLAMLQYLDNQPIETWPAVARFHHQYLPDYIQHEPNTFSDADKKALEARGYTLQALEYPYGNQQVVRWNKKNQKLEAASDPRGIGRAVVTPPPVQEN